MSEQTLPHEKTATAISCKNGKTETVSCYLVAPACAKSKRWGKINSFYTVHSFFCLGSLFIRIYSKFSSIFIGVNPSIRASSISSPHSRAPRVSITGRRQYPIRLRSLQRRVGVIAFIEKEKRVQVRLRRPVDIFIAGHKFFFGAFLLGLYL